MKLHPLYEMTPYLYELHTVICSNMNHREFLKIAMYCGSSMGCSLHLKMNKNNPIIFQKLTSSLSMFGGV